MKTEITRKAQKRLLFKNLPIGTAFVCTTVYTGVVCMKTTTTFITGGGEINCVVLASGTLSYCGPDVQVTEVKDAKLVGEVEAQ